MKEFMEGLQNAGITEEDFVKHLGLILHGDNILVNTHHQYTDELQEAVTFLHFLHDSAEKIVEQRKEN